MAASRQRLLYGRDDACEQFVVSDTVTLNGATAVTTTYTFPRAFAATPKIIGTAAQGGKSVVVTVSALSTTAVTLSALALSGNTDATAISASFEGHY